MSYSSPCLRAIASSYPWHPILVTRVAYILCCRYVHVAAIHGRRLQECRYRSFSHATVQSTRKRASVKINDLPQGTLSLEPIPLENEGPKYPTVVLQAHANMRRFENCVLLTRVGGFYELYFEHAEEYGPLLNLKVAQKKTNAGPVSMVRILFPPLPLL
jgi:MutS domain I